MYSKFSKRVFVEYYENVPQQTSVVLARGDNEGRITSIDDFIALLNESAELYYKSESVPDVDRLVIVDEFPRDILKRLNESSGNVNIDKDTLRDIRVVTFTVDEVPGSIGQHALDEKGIRTIKPIYVGSYDDPEFEGFSIARHSQSIYGFVDFQVWGVDARDVRKRSKLLREIIHANTWYFKHKGLREIVWTGAVESEMWDKQNVVRMKKEKYLVHYANYIEAKEKNVEQVIVQVGLPQQ